MDQQAKERMRAAGLRLAEIEKARAKMAADARETATKLKKEQANNHFKRTVNEALKEVDEKIARTQKKRLIRNLGISAAFVAGMGGINSYLVKRGEEKKIEETEKAGLTNGRARGKPENTYTAPLPRFTYRV